MKASAPQRDPGRWTRQVVSQSSSQVSLPSSGLRTNAVGEKRGRKQKSDEVGAEEIEHVVYPRIPPGEYLARCCVAKVHFDRAFERWVCLLKFAVLNSVGEKIAEVPQWYALGSRKERPFVGRRSRYWKAWCAAAGAPPSRADRMLPKVFRRRFMRVLVRDVKDGSYSVVDEIREFVGSPAQAGVAGDAFRSVPARVPGGPNPPGFPSPEGVIDVSDNQTPCGWCGRRMSASEYRSHTCETMAPRLRASIREFVRRNP